MTTDLERDLGLPAVMAISIGAMVGSGIFVLPGLALEMAGPAVVVAYLLAGLLVLPAALSKSEMATAMPESGGTVHVVRFDEVPDQVALELAREEQTEGDQSFEARLRTYARDASVPVEFEEIVSAPLIHSPLMTSRRQTDSRRRSHANDCCVSGYLAVSLCQLLNITDRSMGETGASEKGWLERPMTAPERRSGTESGSRLDCKVCDLSIIIKTDLGEGEMVRCFRCDAYVRETTN